MAARNASQSLEKEILTRLYPGPQNVPNLVEEISYVKKVTIQGVYKALRALRAEEVVTVHKHTVSLSRIWIQRERDALAFSEEAYRSASYIEGIRNGRVTRAHFTFKTLNEIDLFWTHTFTLLAEKLPNDAYSYAVQPHDWYPYIRFETDAYWIKKHKESNRVTRIILTHAGELDRVVTKMRKDDLGRLFEFTLGENPLKQHSHTYYNIIDSYVFTAQFDRNVAKKLDAFVEKNKTLPLNKEEQGKIREIVNMKGNFTLTIEYNAKKAQRMRDSVRKYFEF